MPDCTLGRLPMVCACEGATPLPGPPGLARLPWGGKGEDREPPSLLRAGVSHLAPPLEYHPGYFLRPRFLLSNKAGNPRPFGDFFTTTTKEGYDMRRVDITPLEQRKLTFDTHALVQDLETHGFDKAQAETIVSALTTLSNVSLDSIYKEMVTRAQQEITVQQLMSHLDSIRKDMVILEKSEFANLRAENQKMKTELEQVKQQLINETSQIRADNKLDINLERSRVTDMFTDQEKKLMEATTEFTSKDTKTRSIISETSNKIDTEIASLKTLMESNKLETIRYLAASVFTCLAIALGFYRIWK
ncbi:coiled-coil domain-containing protein 90B, mitochondrial isoform X2 [Ursus maritimus]|uniref:Coiled-coil domain-containing protein 90B, mitochondrial isoform X2 n=1 Tax=Ursus maritimus TaxID=29073 RepID=A0A384D6J2_URSMA|nr:coiled-coil domain-containing protein 90B, mitochondrial isoform X2 [Ursus maritimus]XP_026373998.2 coiled-coil domain-containing protein 90B, mitochondrial isoform X1 [Ursus arctos]XP_057172868.1 coiled-coil domain-containing protein 90B, mitochondrial isoform X1 [Ursus arctos]